MEEVDWLERTDLLLGKEKLEKLKKSHVLVVGLGGVGAYAAEMICRAGVGNMTIVDGDIIETTNRNRQLPALVSTLGKEKASLVGQRLMDINPGLNVRTIKAFLRDEEMKEFLGNNKFDYVVDAIDTLSPKIYLIYFCMQNHHKLVSSMGSGGKMDPEQIKIADISKTYGCRLAYVIRKKLRHLGIETGFKAVYNPEPIPSSAIRTVENVQNKKSTVGTISYMPAIFGCFCASVVIRDLIEDTCNK